MSWPGRAVGTNVGVNQRDFDVGVHRLPRSESCHNDVQHVPFGPGREPQPSKANRKLEEKARAEFKRQAVALSVIPPFRRLLAGTQPDILIVGRLGDRFPARYIDSITVCWLMAICQWPSRLIHTRVTWVGLWSPVWCWAVITITLGKSNILADTKGEGADPEPDFFCLSRIAIRSDLLIT